MSTFIDLVRTGNVKGPQQNSFKLETWNREYAKFSSPNDVDRSIYAAGIWFHHELSQIRELTNSLKHCVTTSDPKKLFIGIATREWLVLSKKMDERLQLKQAGGFFPEELAHEQLTTVFGTQITPEGVIEMSVDAIRFPLSTFTGPCQGATLEHQVVLRNAGKMFIMAQLYHLLEQLWLELVWNDYRFEENNGKILIGPSSSPLHIAEAVSHFRRQKCQNESIGLAINFWDHSLPAPEKRRALQERKLLTIIKKPTGKIRIKVSEACRHPDNPNAAPIKHIFLTHGYTDNYIMDVVPEFCYLTLHQVILAYDLLSQIPRQMIGILPPLVDVTTPEAAISFAAEFDRVELHNAFRKALKISPEQAEFLLNYMTHTGKVRDQLWFKPIVDLGNGNISILLPAIDGVHFFRLVDHLLKDIPNAEETMGGLFENHVRQSMVELASSYKFAPDLRVYSKSLKFTVQIAFEEIDLAFAIGNRIFIGECKASLYPAEPIEVHNYHKKLAEDAVSQALRKAEFVYAHLDEFVAAVGFELDSKVIEVFPLIVSNGNLYCGYPILNVPVVDISILALYFEKGMLEHLVIKGDNGELVPTRVERFYTSRLEALNNFADYLLHPPQVKLFESAVVLEERRILTSDRSKPAAYKEFAVRPDYDSFREQIKAAQGHEKLT